MADVAVRDVIAVTMGAPAGIGPEVALTLNVIRAKSARIVCPADRFVNEYEAGCPTDTPSTSTSWIRNPVDGAMAYDCDEPCTRLCDPEGVIEPLAPEEAVIVSWSMA